MVVLHDDEFRGAWRFGAYSGACGDGGWVGTRLLSLDGPGSLEERQLWFCLGEEGLKGNIRKFGGALSNSW